jgi:hypothetical protein
MKPPKNRYSTKPPKETVLDKVKKVAKNAVTGGALGAAASMAKDSLAGQPSRLEIKDRIGEDPFGNGFGHIYSGEIIPGTGVYPEQMMQNAADWGLKAAAGVAIVSGLHHALGKQWRKGK